VWWKAHQRDGGPASILVERTGPTATTVAGRKFSLAKAFAEGSDPSVTLKDFFMVGCRQIPQEATLI